MGINPKGFSILSQSNLVGNLKLLLCLLVFEHVTADCLPGMHGLQSIAYTRRFTQRAVKITGCGSHVINKK